MSIARVKPFVFYDFILEMLLTQLFGILLRYWGMFMMNGDVWDVGFDVNNDWEPLQFIWSQETTRFNHLRQYENILVSWYCIAINYCFMTPFRYA